MPFCSITLTAQKPTKLPTVLHTLGDHIKKRRLELGLCQAQVGEILRTAECTIVNWEKHWTEPQLHLIPGILEFLGYDPFPSGANNLGEKLLQYRKSNGTSQRELARRTGIDPATLSRLERASRETLREVNRFLKWKA